MGDNVKLKLSALSHTWLFDLDGTLVKHNGYQEGGDVLLEGVRDFLSSIPEADAVIILTARQESQREETCLFLQEEGVRYDDILFNVPQGERLLINDIKPRGLNTAIAINIDRDAGLNGIMWQIDKTI